jgi:hypothetical protein
MLQAIQKNISPAYGDAESEKLQRGLKTLVHAAVMKLR